MSAPAPQQRRGSMAELERRLARETELAQRQREKTLKQAARREAERRFDEVRRRRLLRYAALMLVLFGTAVLVTLIMFRVLSIVFG